MMSQALDPAIDDLIIASRKEIVFIEDNVSGIDTLTKGIGSGKEIVILDSSQDGLQQIAQALAGRSGIDALHIISHGSTASLNLGTLTLNAGGLDTHAAELQAIGRSMAADGDILLYGCDVGAGGGGAAFVNELAIATGADVAASNDSTGAAALGGDWQLEVTSGKVESQVVVNPETASLYASVLALSSPITVTFDNSANFTDHGDIYSNRDVVYRVDGNAAYQLVIDGKDRGVISWPGYGYVNIAGQPDSSVGETMATISFLGHQVFTPTSFHASVMYTSGAPGSNDHAQNLIITGYDTENHIVKSMPFYLPAGDGYSTVFLDGFTNIARLTITTNDNYGVLKFLGIDDLTLTNVQSPPEAQEVTSSASGTHKIGDVIDIKIIFDSAVDVTGIPRLLMETGATDSPATYYSGSGTSTLIFRYTVQAGDASGLLDYVSSSSIDLNGGTITSHSNTGISALLNLPTARGFGSLSAHTSITIDGIVPTVAITSDKSVLKNGDTATITFTFSEDPGSSFTWDGSTGDLIVNGGTLSAISGTGTTRIATFTPSANVNSGTASITVNPASYADDAGNLGTAGAGPSITVDTVVPTVSVFADTSVLKAGGTATITFVFSEDPGPSFDAGDLTVTGGTLSAISGSGLTRTATFSPTANVNNGTASISVIANSYSDAAGNNGTAGSLSTPITYDTLAPTLTIVSDKPFLKAGETATITFSFSEDPGSSFTWNGSTGDLIVNGGTLSAISGTGTTRTAIFTPNLDNNAGIASIAIRGSNYQDAKGNTGSDASLSFGFDTQAPSSPSAPDLADSQDSGASNSDDVTNSSMMTFNGAAENGATVRLYDGATEIGHATATNGIYSIVITGLGEGSHTLTAVAFDAAGNASAASTALAIMIDRTAPTTQVLSAFLSDDTGRSDTDMVTSSATQTISGTLGANLASGERVEVSLDNGGQWIVATVNGQSWSLDTVLSGSNVLQVRVVDAAGNAGTTFTHAYTLDTVATAAPSAPDLNAGSDTGISTSDNITSDTTPSFSGTAEIGATVTLYDGATAIGSTIATDGTWSITSNVLASGDHVITARATDLAGNQGPASGAAAVSIMTTPPSTEIQTAHLSVDSGASGTDFITNVAAQTVTGTLSRILSTGERVQVSLDHGASWNDAVSAVGNNTWSLATVLVDGSHDIQVRVIDPVDNSGPVLTRSYTLDTTAPSVSSVGVPADRAYSTGEALTFTLHADEAVFVDTTGGTPHITLDVGGVIRYATYVSGSGTADLRFAYTLQDGESDSDGITVVALSVNGGSLRDVAGNDATLTLTSVGSTANVIVDAVMPGILEVTSTAQDGAYRVGDTLTLSVELSEVVNVDPSRGTPTLALAGGGTAVYASGSGTSTLLFTYIVQAGHASSDLDYRDRTALALNGGTIRDAAGNDATLILPTPGSAGSLGSNKNIVIDGVAPTLSQSSPASGTTSVEKDANLVLTFSEAITAGNGVIELHSSSGALVESFNVATSDRISLAGDTLVIDPTNSLAAGTSYYLTISAGAVRDWVGNSLAGFTDGATLRFATAGPIVTPTGQGGLSITITDASQLTASLGSRGVDTVFYAGAGTINLPGPIENITLTGPGNATAIGNGQTNIITGNAGSNRLYGSGGNDRLFGGGGSDRLDGGTGNDYLNGGSGSDTMAGGVGNDVYVVDSHRDHVVESRNAGSDTVYSSVSYRLGAGVENLVLTGAASSGTGNSLSNILHASSRSSTLNGLAGNDRLYGGAGNDVLIGGSGNDMLNGGRGSDRLQGGAGSDVFVFNTRPDRGAVDTIMDFNRFEDKILLDHAVFTALGGPGVLARDAFVWIRTAVTPSDRILYDIFTGALYYDPDGSGKEAAVQFAKVDPWKFLTYDDFWII